MALHGESRAETEIAPSNRSIFPWYKCIFAVASESKRPMRRREMAAEEEMLGLNFPTDNVGQVIRHGHLYQTRKRIDEDHRRVRH